MKIIFRCIAAFLFCGTIMTLWWYLWMNIVCMSARGYLLTVLRIRENSDADWQLTLILLIPCFVLMMAPVVLTLKQSNRK